MDAAAGPAHLRPRPGPDDGDRQPHPGLVLRPGGDLRRGPAQERVDRVVEEGAEIVDIGGVRAGYGEQVDAAEEIRRVVAVRRPGCASGIPAWSSAWTPGASEVAREVCAAGADLLNDAWGGARPRGWWRWRPSSTRPSSARTPAGCRRGPTPTGSSTTTWSPRRSRRRPPRRASPGGRGGARVDRHRPGPRLRQEHLPLPGGDPAARRDGRHGLAGPRLPVQQGLRRRDARRCRPSERLTGTLAATAVCALAGARIYRVHQVPRDPADGRHGVVDRRPAAAAAGDPGPPVTPGRPRARRARAAARVRRPGGPGARAAGRGPGSRRLAGGGRSGHGGRGRAGLPRRAAPAGGCRRGRRVARTSWWRNGSARRNDTAPGYVDERAVPFDAAVEAALRGPTPRRSRAWTSISRPRCWSGTRPAWCGWGPCCVAPGRR